MNWSSRAVRAVRAARGTRSGYRPGTITRRLASTKNEKKSGDMPWLVGSVAVTVPAVAYLMTGEKADAHQKSHEDVKTELPRGPKEGAANSKDETAKEEQQEQKGQGGEGKDVMPENEEAQESKPMEDRPKQDTEKQSSDSSEFESKTHQTNEGEKPAHSTDSPAPDESVKKHSGPVDPGSDADNKD